MSKSNYEKYAEVKQQELLHKERNLLQAIDCLKNRQKFASLQCIDGAIDFVADLYDLSIDEVKRAMDREEYWCIWNSHLLGKGDKYSWKKTYFELKCGQSGFLVDGRFYNILSIPSVMMCSDGSYKYGDIEVGINNEYYKMRISEFMENVKTKIPRKKRTWCNSCNVYYDM